MNVTPLGDFSPSPSPRGPVRLYWVDIVRLQEGNMNGEKGETPSRLPSVPEGVGAPQGGPERAETAVEARPRAPGPLPSRYRLTGGKGRMGIISMNAPNITLVYERGVTATRFMLRRKPRGTIFLDGACAGPPFYDNRRRHYSLDHHEGCVRSFTLASCEQAAVVLYEGMPLSDGAWTIIINSIDLDSVLAAWVLMNHTELLDDGRRFLEKAMPILRVEGCIDSHGLDAGVLSGLLPEQRARHESDLAVLFSMSKGVVSLPPEEACRLVVRMLGVVDSLVFPRESIAEFLAYEELGRVQLAAGGIAILVRSESGIYEAENFFKARYGDALDIIVLSQGEGLYSLRLVNRFMRDDLHKLYDRLNRLDPLVSHSAEKGDNTWGGSSNIGGSPRQTGSGLRAEVILDAMERAYGSLPTRIMRFLGQKRRSR